MANTVNFTKEKILDAAETLILKYGLISTSILDICKSSGVSKGCFFHHFKDKHDLAAQVVMRFAMKRGALFTTGSFLQESTAKARLFKFFEDFGELVKHPDITQGCVVGIVGQEMGMCDENYRKITEAAFTPILEFITGLLDAAKKEQTPKQDYCSKELSSYLLSLMQGSMVVIRSTGRSEIMHKNVLLFSNYLRAFWD